MESTGSRTSSLNGGRALLLWGAILFGVGAMTALLFSEGAVQWPLGWPFYHETGILIGAIVAVLGHALLVAGLVRPRP